MQQLILSCLGGFALLTDRQMDIGDCRVVFTTEKNFQHFYFTDSFSDLRLDIIKFLV